MDNCVIRKALERNKDNCMVRIEGHKLDIYSNENIWLEELADKIGALEFRIANDDNPNFYLKIKIIPNSRLKVLLNGLPKRSLQRESDPILLTIVKRIPCNTYWRQSLGKQ